jgi:predicted aspartyl protease
MLVQRCALDQHRLILPVSVSKPSFDDGNFRGNFSQQQHRALVDTGAQRTVVSRSVIAGQNLIRTGHMEFSGLHGPQTHSRYLASIGIWTHRIENNAASVNLAGSELSLFAIETPFEVVNMDDNINFDLILGFDVLKSFSFNFDNRNKVFEIIVKP